MGGHYLRLFWPSNASHYTGRAPEARPTSHNTGARRLEGLLSLRKIPFKVEVILIKLKTIEEILSPKGFQKLAISAILEEV